MLKMQNLTYWKTRNFGGYQSWVNRGRYRSPGDGQVDFKIFSKLSQYDFKGYSNGMGMLYKNQEDGAKEGAEFIRNHIIKVTDKAFDDFAAVDSIQHSIKKILGL
jgi:sugar phosphate isomerase/epimerase